MSDVDTVPPPSPAGPPTSAPSVTTAGPVVMGDGTTGTGRARSRWRRLRLPLLVLVLVVLAAVLAAVIRPPTTALPYAPDNPDPAGARAVAEILKRQGVDIRKVRRFAEATELATAGTTVLVLDSHLLGVDQATVLADSGADLVLPDPDWLVLETVTDGRIDTGWQHGSTSSAARCDDPHARAAERITSTGYGFTAVDAADPGVTVCFPKDDPAFGAYAVLDDGGRRVLAVEDASVLTNEHLDETGNAALALRALGANDTLVWYLPTFADTSTAGDAAPDTGSLLPDWAGPLALQLVLVVLALGFWRARGLGPVVTEPLPVVVRAAEATLGRGRLYRRARSRGHAAASLRAGTARRAALRLGLPRSAGAPEVIDALARTTGRPAEEVSGLLYGPPPTDDPGLLHLARQLDELESEVHRS